MLKIKNINSQRFFPIRNFLNLNLISREVLLAGGSLISLIDESYPIQDYDLFFLNPLLRDSTEQKIINLGGKKHSSKLDGGIRRFILNNIQIDFSMILGRNYFSPKDLLDSLDINASRIAFDGEHLYFYRETIRDIRDRRVTLNYVANPKITMKRIVKYSERGFDVGVAAREVVRGI